MSYTLEPVFKNENDETFAKDLIKKTTLNTKKFDIFITDIVKKWELERIAFLDRVILHLALCELTQMPNIPVKVTINEYLDISHCYSTPKSSIFINEYLDISHCYSTPKSSIFINGIIDRIYEQLNKENKLYKLENENENEN